MQACGLGIILVYGTMPKESYGILPRVNQVLCANRLLRRWSACHFGPCFTYVPIMDFIEKTDIVALWRKGSDRVGQCCRSRRADAVGKRCQRFSGNTATCAVGDCLLCNTENSSVFELIVRIESDDSGFIRSPVNRRTQGSAAAGTWERLESL